MIITILKVVCVLFLFIFIGYVIYVLLERRRIKSTLKGYFPTAPGLPGILGHLHLGIILKNSGEMLEHIILLNKMFTKGCIAWFGHICLIGIKDIDIMEKVLASNETVEKGHIYDIFKAFMNGIFVQQPTGWRPLRKKLNTTMNPKLMDNYLVKMNQEAGTLVDVLAHRINETFNVIEDIQHYFFDIVTMPHVGITTSDQVDRKYNITHLSSKCSEILINQCVLRPYLYNNRIYEMTPFRRQLDVFRKPLMKAMEMVFQTRLDDVKKSPDLKSNYVYADLVYEHLKEKNITPNARNISVQAGDMIIAGSDTTSVAISSLLYFLARDEIWQEKVYKEVSEIYGDCKHRELTKSDLNRMVLLEMCMKEALRLSSPPGIVRYLTQDFNAGKCILPKGTMLFLMFSLLHHDPEYFERPNEFYPEHFLPENVSKRPRLAFLPFSYGPRNCPGFHYAMLAMKCAASAIIHNYRLSSDLKFEDVKIKFIFLKEFVDGYPIKIIPRK